MSTKTDKDEMHKVMKDVYYEVRIGTAMLVLIMVMNLFLLFLCFLGILYWLDSAPKIG